MERLIKKEKREEKTVNLKRGRTTTVASPVHTVCINCLVSLDSDEMMSPIARRKCRLCVVEGPMIPSSSRCLTFDAVSKYGSRKGTWIRIDAHAECILRTGNHSQHFRLLGFCVVKAMPDLVKFQPQTFIQRWAITAVQYWSINLVRDQISVGDMPTWFYLLYEAVSLISKDVIL